MKIVREEDFLIETGMEIQSLAPKYSNDLTPYCNVVFLVKNRSPLEASLVLCYNHAPQNLV